MQTPEFTIIIPARYASSRFPGKPLAKIGDREMVLRVADRASEAAADVVVATDDERIYKCVSAGGHRAVMTSADHRSGTDRVWEAFTKLYGDDTANRVVINVQGDEPFISPLQIKTLMQIFIDNPETRIATLARPFQSDAPYSALADPNLVKLTRRPDGTAITFSRSIIPYLRGVDTDKWPSSYPYLTHIGIYAYRADDLRSITSMPQSALEKAESLEQLRWLEAGIPIAVGISTEPTVGIDTPADLEAACRMLDKIL